jgi:hypothetical protein
MKGKVYWRGLSVRLDGLGAWHEQAWYGGPGRGRTYGPLIKSPAEDPLQNTHYNESTAKREDS